MSGRERNDNPCYNYDRVGIENEKGIVYSTSYLGSKLTAMAILCFVFGYVSHEFFNWEELDIFSPSLEKNMDPSFEENTDPSFEESVDPSIEENMDPSFGNRDEEFLHPTRAVIHMGPHKTGTTTIQEQSSTYQDKLKLDGYEMPWKLVEETIGVEGNPNQKHFSSCFMFPDAPERTSERKCDPELLLEGLDIGHHRRHHLLVSAETFSMVDTERLYLLQDYTSNWNEVVIIIYYRRFHDWVGSSYNEDYKHRTFTNSHMHMWGNDINEIIDHYVSDPRANARYTLGLVARINEVFDNVVVVDMLDENFKGPDESFFCHALPYATNTCEAIRAETRTKHTNKRKSLDYGDLAYGAMKLGLITIQSDEDMKQVTRDVKHHQEETLNLTSSDYKKKCPSKDIMDMIWETSLRSEMEFFPGNINGTSTTDDLRSSFEIAALSTLCQVDVDATLEEQVWVEFFESYSY